MDCPRRIARVWLVPCPYLVELILSSCRRFSPLADPLVSVFRGMGLCFRCSALVRLVVDLLVGVE